MNIFLRSLIFQFDGKKHQNAQHVSFISFIIVMESNILNMETYKEIKKPTKEEQNLALESYDALASVIEDIKSHNPEIEIEETKDRIRIPLNALKLLGEILKVMSEGKPFSIVPIATEVSTQKAAEILGCSRPHIVKLLEGGKIEFTKIGKHRRVKYEDVIQYKRKLKEAQKRHIIDIMKSDEELELYDS